MTEFAGRRKAFLRLSVGNWITVGIFTIGIIASWFGFAIAYGGKINQVNNNTKAITEIKQEMKENTKQLRKEIKDSAGETQQVMRDQIQLILRVIEKE